MQFSLQNGTIIIELHEIEAQVLCHILSLICKNYETRPEEMDPRARAVWYSSRGCRSAGMSEEEIDAWIDSLHEYKSENLELCRKLRMDLEVPAEPRVLKIPSEYASEFLSILNDHRLFLAAVHDIDESKMEISSQEEVLQLSFVQFKALREIDFLAEIMERILKLITPNRL